MYRDVSTFRIAVVAAKLNDGTSVQVAVVVGACKSSALGHDLGRCVILLPATSALCRASRLTNLSIPSQACIKAQGVSVIIDLLRRAKITASLDGMAPALAAPFDKKQSQIVLRSTRSVGRLN
jgi:hypothetical protein